LNLLDKAINLAYYELLGDAGEINLELENYRKVQPEEIFKTANTIFQNQRKSVLIYQAN